MPEPQRQGKGHQEAKGELDQLTVGDIVAYSKAFLQSIGAYTGDMPQAKGKLTGLVPVGRELILAEVSWDRAELPSRVNIKSLCRVGSRAYSE
jgi:hypothetical protein